MAFQLEQKFYTPSTIPPWVTMTRSFAQSHETPGFDGPPPFSPFGGPGSSNNNDAKPLRDESDNDSDEAALSPGIIAAIVVSIFALLVLLAVFSAYICLRRRKARGNEVALKEITSDPVVTVSGALDPPPPYDEVHTPGHLPGQAHRWDSRSVTTTGEMEDSDAMGSHATITDGLDPGRHGSS